MAKQASIFSFFNKSATPSKKDNVDSKNTIKLKGLEVTELSIVWGKLEGHPWWPGLVCKPPHGDSFVRKKSLHLQFFEDPPSRGWVRESFLKPYGEPIKVGVPTYKDSAWRVAREMADQASRQSIKERRALLVEHQESDQDMSGHESDEEVLSGNSSKENMDDSNMSNNSSSVATPSGGKKRTNKSKNSAEPQKKKRRIVLKSDSEESADEYKPGKEEESSDESVSSGEDEANISVDEPPPSEDEPSPSPVKKNILKSTRTPSTNGTHLSSPKPYTPSAPPFSPYTPTAPPYTPSSASPALKSKLALFAAKETNGEESPNGEAGTPGSAPKQSFLLPENIRDAQGRRPSNPDYDPRTVKVPEEFLNQQTPGHRQWWLFKSQHFDCVLFFKMGKFYELFYMDAEIGVQELGLLLMKGANPHSGFPEISYCRYSASLIEKGYKVARIEQTETPDMMEKRCKTMSRPTKFDRVVRREICQLSSSGTRVWGVQDAEPTAANPAYLLAVIARTAENTETLQFGVAFIDTSLGEFHLGQFVDDRHNSRLRTLLAHHPPVQILTERNHVPAAARTILTHCGVASGLQETLASESEFWTASKTLQFLAEEGVFGGEDGRLDWPTGLKELIDAESLNPLENLSDLSLSALGALVWYLRRCCQHRQLLTRRLFSRYCPPDCQEEAETDEEGTASNRIRFTQRTMVIDGGSAVNLELLCNGTTGEVQGSLLAVLDHTASPMGKRLLRQWVSAPLVCSAAIARRLDAVEELRQHGDVATDATKLLSKLPDIERLLPRIHSQGLKFSPSDPNSRAIYYEEQQYGKKRVQSFLTAIEAFKTIMGLPDIFTDLPLESALLRSLVTPTSEGGKLPIMKETLQFFEKAFNHETAKKEGKIIPCSGVDNQYDEALNTISQTKEDLDEYLREQAKYFGAKVAYFGSDRKRYQLEVPESAVKRATSAYELVSQRKGFKRFHTTRSKELLAQMTAAEEASETALNDIARRIFQQFDEKQSLWSNALECITCLDVLISLAKYSNSVQAVRPQIIDLNQGEQPFLEIRDGIHPCIMGMSQDDIIPNDVVIGADGGEGAHAPLVLVTGPNMGGKSTLMRQTALLAVMAQMGSFVPCASIRLSPVDRIFTRVGASDRMMAGESTFLLELRETAAILQHATQHALVLIDELGRGTATHDGTAVAWAVAGALTERGCRTLFSTHYHGLVHHFAHTPGVSMGHMACMVEGGDDDETGGEETVTFLYKFSAGVCPKSYGFNAARLAEIPAPVVQEARTAARLMEGRSDALLAFKKLFTDSTVSVAQKRDVLKTLAPVLKAVGAC